MEHSCALLKDKTLRCWGSNQHGELGSGSTSLASLSPLAVASLPDVVQIAAGPGMHSCARLASAAIACWGLNDHGQTADGASRGVVPTPALVAGVASATDIAVGAAHSCAVLGDGSVMCWGANDEGQLGDGTRVDHRVPAKVASIATAVHVALGDRHSCALLADNSVRCWGSNTWGESGSQEHDTLAASGRPGKVGTSNPTPVAVEGLTGATQLALGAGRSCARIADGTVKCWGSSAFEPKPKAVPKLGAVVAIAGAGRHMCALLEGGTVRCWGSNAFGQLGDGTRRERRQPGEVRDLGGVVGLSVGPEHACARLRKDTAVCWGSNGSGKLGDGTREWRMVPTPVAW